MRSEPYFALNNPSIAHHIPLVIPCVAKCVACIAGLLSYADLARVDGYVHETFEQGAMLPTSVED
jgi:hypothetical protein